MACYLRASGSAFDVDAFLSGSSLACDRVWRKGDRKKVVRKGSPAQHEDSGLSVRAADSSDHFASLVADTIAFLRSNEHEMARLSRWPGVESVYLDFAVHWHPDSAAQFTRLPPELLGLAGQYGFWVEISHYLTEPASVEGERAAVEQ